MMVRGLASVPPPEFSDAAGLHRRLAAWSYRRLEPGAPNSGWRARRHRNDPGGKRLH